jgi:hypothetical protein
MGSRYTQKKMYREGEEEEMEEEGGEMDQWLHQQELQVRFFVWKANLETPNSESPRRKKEKEELDREWTHNFVLWWWYRYLAFQVAFCTKFGV